MVLSRVSTTALTASSRIRRSSSTQPFSAGPYPSRMVPERNGSGERFEACIAHGGDLTGWRSVGTCPLGGPGRARGHSVWSKVFWGVTPRVPARTMREVTANQGPLELHEGENASPRRPITFQHRRLRVHDTRS